MKWAVIGAVFMGIGVAAGAFGAHLLKTRLSPDLLAIFDLGVRYQLIHGLGLFVVAWLSHVSSSGLVTAAGRAFSFGIVVFSGSLYVLALTGIPAWGAVTPVGGLAFLIGWLLVAAAAFQVSK